MKKILSTLVMCLILGVGSVWADVVSGKATAVLYSNNTCQAEKGGWVAVLQGVQKNAPADNSSEWKRKTDLVSDATNSIKDLYAYVYMHARSENGYYFAEWAQSYTSSSYTALSDTKSKDYHTNKSTDNPIYYYAGALSGSDGENIQRYAIFKPVTVDAMTIDGEAITSKTLNSTDKNGYKEATIVFTTAHADDWNDFVNDAVVLEGDSRFTIQSSNRDGNTVTVVVRFTDDDHHVLDGTLPSATVTLTSKGDATSKKTATITATSDLTPRTTITPSPCDLTPSSPVLAGNTVSATLNVAAAVGYTNVFAEATITAVEFTNPEDAELKGYTLDATDPKAPVVSFTPTEFSINQANVETEICVTTTYTDKSGKEITHTECVTITADAGKIITIGGVKDAVMDFGIIDYTETNVPVQMEYPIYSTLAATDFTPTESGFTADISKSITFVGSGATTDNVIVTANSTPVPNDYTATLTYTENGADPISASLTVKVSIKLAKPVVTATVPDGNVTLTWPAVYGANRYIIKSEGVEIATVTETTYKVTNIGGQELTTGRQYPFTVTAVYDAYPEKGNRESDIVCATPGIPTVITYGDINDINMYTGTEMGAGDGGVYESFPYSKKRKIQLNRIFDGTTHEPLFDELYIFGLTTETDGTHDNINLPSASLGCNATTPLYVYTKSGNEYVKTAEYDAVEKRFDHGTNKNGKHLYFTGYCPFANIGVNPADEGWMYFAGGNTGVDIYLENCTILGRYRTTSGKSSGFAENVVTLVASSIGAANENINYMSGFSSIFVFSSLSSDSEHPYKPTIHISGDNHLKGQLGYISKVIGLVKISIIEKEVETGIGNITTVSSPITIKPDANGGYTDLTMDDLWPTNATHTTKEVTNGFLRLDTYKTSGSVSEKVPCVDLGSEYGSLTINGGQYMLRNSAADGTYTCNMAFSYRKFSKLAQKEVLGMQVEALLSLYGFGGDQTDCRVVINGGTFNMYKNMYQNGTSYLGSNYYIDQDNFLDLRLPAGRGSRFSHINGGTFNGISHVVFCSQVTSSGKSPINHTEEVLCLQDVVIEGPNVDQNNGTVKFVVPEPFSDYYDETDDDKVGYNLSTGLDAVEMNELYGGQSANSYTKNIGGEDKNVVSILLPAGMCEDATCTDCELFDEAIYYNWVTAIPMFNISVEGQEVSIGGEVEVPTTEGGEIKYVVNQMLYTDLKGMEDAAMTGDINIGFADKNNTRGQFTNPDNYRIYKNLNMLKVVEADRWYCFVAPYDIHEISVIETAETQLSKDPYKNDRTAAKALQAQNNLKMLYELSNFILPDPNGRATSLTLNELLPKGGLGMPGLERIPLKHYNGSDADEDEDENHGANIFESNYYLYEIPDDDGLSITEGGDLNINWVEVKREAGQPLMYQGKVYAIQFPWCSMCNDWENRTYYDYWTGKLILFYGHGYDNAGTENDGQLIYGIDHQTSTILKMNPGEGTAMYSGNYTLADMTAPSGAYVHQYVDIDPNDDDQRKQDWFIQPTTSYTVKPTEGYLLYTPKAGAQMPARISRTGQIEYDENVETGLPTIAGRTSLMLYGAYDGFEVLSFSEQLVTVYNLQGNIIFQQYMAEGEQVYVATGAGVFIVRGESETIKVMVE